MFMGILSTWMSVCQVCSWCPRNPEKDGSLGTGITGCCKPRTLGFEPRSSERALLTAEPFFQPLSKSNGILASLESIFSFLLPVTFPLWNHFLNKIVTAEIKLAVKINELVIVSRNAFDELKCCSVSKLKLHNFTHVHSSLEALSTVSCSFEILGR